MHCGSRSRRSTSPRRTKHHRFLRPYPGDGRCTPADASAARLRVAARLQPHLLLRRCRRASRRAASAAMQSLRGGLAAAVLIQLILAVFVSHLTSQTRPARAACPARAPRRHAAASTSEQSSTPAARSTQVAGLPVARVGQEGAPAAADLAAAQPRVHGQGEDKLGELGEASVPGLARCTSFSSAICTQPGRRCVSETPAKGGALWALGRCGRRRAVLRTRPRQAALSVSRRRSPRHAAPSCPWSVWWAHRVLRRVRAPRRGTAVGGARGGPPAAQEVERGRAQSCLRVPRAGRTCGFKGARIWRCELIPRWGVAIHRHPLVIYGYLG